MINLIKNSKYIIGFLSYNNKIKSAYFLNLATVIYKIF